MLPAHVVLVRLVRVPAGVTKHREGMLRFEAAQRLPLPLAELAWDHAACGRSDGEDVVLLFAAKDAVVAPLAQALEDCALSPERFVPGSFALLEAWRREAGRRPDAPATLLVDAGIRTTTVLRWEGAECREIFTMALPAPDAKAPAAQDIERWIGRLAEELRRSSPAKSGASAGTGAEQLRLTGAGAAPGLAAELQARTGRKVALFAPGWTLAEPDGEAVCPERFDAVASIALIGGAAAALRPERECPDLLPAKIRARNLVRRRRPWLAAAAVVALAVPWFPLQKWRGESAGLRTQVATADARIAELSGRLEQERKLAHRRDLLVQEVQRLDELQRRRGSWLRFLRDLHDRLESAEDAWLDHLRFGLEGRGTEARPLVELGGRLLLRAEGSPAGAVPRERSAALLGELASLPGVSAVREVRFDDGPPGLLRFELVLVLDRRLPL